MGDKRVTTSHVTTCRLCPAFCGMIVELDGERVVKARGDPEHPLSRGYLCPKGRALPAFHHHAKRLDRPLVGGQTTTWEHALDGIAGQIRSIMERAGPNGIGMYTGSGGGWDSTSGPVINGFLGKIGSRQRYSPITCDVAPAIRASELVTGYHWEIRPEWFPGQDAPKLAVVIGSNPVASHGNLGLMLSDPTRWLREYTKDGGELWVIDPRRTDTARIAHRHLAPIPGTDGVLLGWLARELLRDGADRNELENHCTREDVERLRAGLEPFTLDVAVRRTGVEAEALTDLLQAIRRAGKIAMTTGTGLSFGRHGLLTQWLRWVVLILTGSIDHREGMYASAGWHNAYEARETWNPIPLDVQPETPETRPDLPMWFGEIPCIALAEQIESGLVKGMFIHGGKPLTSIPDPDRLLAALKSLELLVVIDVVTNEMTEIATHVLPAVSMLERSDVTGDGFLSHVAYCEQVLPAVGERRPTWWMIGQIGKRLGVDALDGLDPDAATGEELLARWQALGRHSAEELFAAGPRGLPIPRRYGWVRERALPNGRWRLAPPQLAERLPELLAEEPKRRALRLVSGRELHNHNSMAYGRYGSSRFSEDDTMAAVSMNPRDAAERGLEDGDVVEIESDDGKVRAKLKVSHSLRVGAVHIVHGWLGKNVTRLSPTDVDPMHGQPVMSAIAVDVIKAIAPT
jgi:anaerobic selenocysteine-containing dehydrogenase